MQACVLVDASTQQVVFVHYFDTVFLMYVIMQVLIHFRAPIVQNCATQQKPIFICKDAGKVVICMTIEKYETCQLLLICNAAYESLSLLCIMETAKLIMKEITDMLVTPSAMHYPQQKCHSKCYTLAQEWSSDMSAYLMDYLDELHMVNCTQAEVCTSVEKPKGKVESNAPMISIGGYVHFHSPQIKYKRNECFADLLEHVTFIKNSTAMNCTSCKGTLKIKSHLSGVPEMRVGMSKQLILIGSHIKYHSYVRVRPDSRDIALIPPDQEFELLQYDLSHLNDISCPIHVEYKHQPLSKQENSVSMQLRAACTSLQFVQPIRIVIPTCKKVTSYSVQNMSNGTIKYDASKLQLQWTIYSWYGESPLLLHVTYQHDDNWLQTAPLVQLPSAQVQFQVLNMTTSNICVRYIKIHEKSAYQVCKWYRSMCTCIIQCK